VPIASAGGHQDPACRWIAVGEVLDHLQGGDGSSSAPPSDRGTHMPYSPSVMQRLDHRFGQLSMLVAPVGMLVRD
jgi:hypothetical protein